MLGHRDLIFEDYLNILRRRRWIILLPIVTIPLLAWITMKLVPARYVSRTLVLIEQQRVPDEYVKPVVNDDLNQRISSLREEINSRTRLEPIIERFQLYPNIGPGMDEKIVAMRKAIDVKPIKSDLGMRAQGPPGFTISFQADQPLVAQQVCSEITSLFLSENLRARASAVQGTTDFIRSQLEDAKRNLDGQEAKLAAFERQHFGEMPEQEQSNIAMMTTLTSQLDAATQSLAQLQQNRLYLDSMIAQSSQDSVRQDSQSQSPGEMELELQKKQAAEADLEARYTPDHPDVVKLKRDIEAEKKRVEDAQKAAARATAEASPAKIGGKDTVQLAQMKAQLHAADRAIEDKKQEQERIKQRIADYQVRIHSSPLVQEQMKELTRDHQTALQFYNDLLAKKNHSEMAGDLEKRQQGEQFRVMDAANLPDRPDFPDARVFLGGGFLGGIALGIGLAVWLEYRDRALRNERDVFAFTGMATLANVPFTLRHHRHGLRSRFPLLLGKSKHEVQG